jgi:transposase
MVYAAIDIHKSVFQAAVLGGVSGEISDARFPATREALRHWAMPLRGRVDAVAIEATTGWRWVWRELSGLGFDVRLVDPGQARALRGRTRKARTDRLDARWLVVLLAKELLPEAFLPSAEIQRLRDKTRLRKRLVEDRTRWAQRLHAFLTHEGWPRTRGRLLTEEGRRWAAAIALAPAARAQVDTLIRVISLLEGELEPLKRELRVFARTDARAQALQSIFGVGPILACHLLAELGQAKRFRRALPGRPGRPVSTRSWLSQGRANGAAGSQSTARPSCGGRWLRPPTRRPCVRRAPTVPSTSRQRLAAAIRPPHSPSRARSLTAPTTVSVNSRRRRPPEAAATMTTRVRDTKAPPHGEICGALLPSPGTHRAAQTGVSRRRNANQTSRAATARAKIGTGRQPRTDTTRPPPQTPRLDAGGPLQIGRCAGQAGGGRARGGDRLAVGSARARGARLRRPALRSRAGAGAARLEAAAEDRPARRPPGWCGCSPRRCCRSAGCRPRTSSACATAPVWAARSPRTDAFRATLACAAHPRGPAVRPRRPAERLRSAVGALARAAAAGARERRGDVCADRRLEQIATIDAELRQQARSDSRPQALCTIFGVGPVLAAHSLAESRRGCPLSARPPAGARRRPRPGRLRVR